MASISRAWRAVGIDLPTRLEPSRSPRVETITQAGQFGDVGGRADRGEERKQNVMAAPPRPCATRVGPKAQVVEPLATQGNFRCRRRGTCCRKGGLFAGDATGCRHLQDVRSSFSVLPDRKLNWFLNWFALPSGAIYYFRSHCSAFCRSRRSTLSGLIYYKYLVGAARFELATPSPPD
jgi:hypothetical protein